MPDSERFGDVGVNTLRSCAGSQELHIPNLRRAGLGNIQGLSFLGRGAKPHGGQWPGWRRPLWGRTPPLATGRLRGVVSPKPLPTYPQGFPRRCWRPSRPPQAGGVLCNRPYSGTDVIRDYGAEQLKTGKWIVYTSADSVFQIAAHEECIPLEELYAACRKARRFFGASTAWGGSSPGPMWVLRRRASPGRPTAMIFPWSPPEIHFWMC